ncbi:hypothetical protein Q7P37_007379 [Cladosporium fusiforme]
MSSTPSGVEGQGQESAPYRPSNQALGQVPSIIPDVPVNVVFLLFFILGGASHMFLLKKNGRNGKKFGISGAIFGFCVTRVLATSLRIAWANHPRHIPVAMAAMIFVYAGVILLFIANLFFTQRIVRAQHPHFGWSKPFSLGLPILMGVIIATILSLISAVIMEFYSRSETIHTAVRDIQIYGATFYAVIAFLPIPIVGISTLARQHPKIKHTQTTDKFGEGSMTAKVAIVIFSAGVLTLGAGYRAGTTWLPPVASMAAGPWYFSRGSFYAFNFSLELFMVLFWLAVRIDKRFIIPNGAKGPYSYGSGFVFAGEVGNEKPQLGVRDSTRHLTGSQATGFTSSHNSTRGSRVSWAHGPGSRRSSMGAASRVSWGGISREDVSAALGEDGIQVVPYLSDDEAGQTAGDVGVEGMDQEMGWDPKSGKWALRPVSELTTLEPAMMRPHSNVEGV